MILTDGQLKCSTPQTPFTNTISEHPNAPVALFFAFPTLASMGTDPVMQRYRRHFLLAPVPVPDLVAV